MTNDKSPPLIIKDRVIQISAEDGAHYVAFACRPSYYRVADDPDLLQELENARAGEYEVRAEGSLELMQIDRVSRLVH